MNKLKLNMLLNSLNSVLTILISLIISPYISKTLGVENVGLYTFSNTVISYFVLIAGLGIRTYSIKEGSKIRDDKEKFNMFASEMFSFNVLTVLCSYVLLAVCLLFPHFSSYKIVILILSLNIVSDLLSVNWVFSIYENYAFITIKNLIVKIFSLILIFVFVKDYNDTNTYAIITGITTFINSVINLLYSNKYCKLELTTHINIKSRIKSILVFFATNATTTLYSNSDILILGFLSTNYIVGIYSVSSKIYVIVKTILSSIIETSYPRLISVKQKQNKDEWYALASNIYKTLITYLLPAILGIIVLRKEIIIIFSDVTYIKASSSLFILSFAVFFALSAYFWGLCILVSNDEEKIFFNATLISCIVNIVLNFVLIPIGKENAAALTTVIAEIICYLTCRHFGSKFIRITGIKKTYAKVLVGCAMIPIIAKLFRFINSTIIYTFMVVLVSIIVYYVIEILLKNETIQFSKNKIGKQK